MQTSMTNSEIDLAMEDMHQFRLKEPVRGLEFSHTLIAASEKINYAKHLPQLWLYRGELLVRVGENSAANEAFDHAITYAQTTSDKRIIGRALCGKGTILTFNYQYPEAKALMEESVSLALSANDTVGRGLALGNLSEIYNLWGLKELAAGYAKESYEVLADTDSVTLPLHRLGILSSAAGDLEEAEKYLTRGLNFIEERQYKFAFGPYCIELGNLYSRKEDFLLAKKWYLRALEACNDIGDVDNTLTSKHLLAANEIKLKNYSEAEAQLIELLNEPPGPDNINHAWCQYYLAFSSGCQGQMEKALSMLFEYFPDEERLWQQSQLAEGVYYLYIECYTALENWKNAAHFEKKLREYREQINSEQFKARLTTAQSLIATEREKNEKELEKMKREQLERELSNTTLQLLAQTEALSEFRESILAVVRRVPPTDAIAKELKEKLKVLPCKSIDWDKFEAQFKAAHPEFRVHLFAAFPDLTKMEIRICTLIRMNLKSDDISRLTCLSERNIENHRYRIRKKMKLGKEQDLGKELSKL
jgi:tetratricopeptide (TPR) repeat protein/DNA-binding CsgD family transcriptional regulator